MSLERIRVDLNTRYWGGAFLKVSRRWLRDEPTIGQHVAVYDVGAPELGDLDAVVVGLEGRVLLYVFDLDRAAEFNQHPAYWVEDASMTREETLRRFQALDPQPTGGPAGTSTSATTVTLTWP